MSEYIQVFKAEKNLLPRVKVAKTYWSRMKGLLGKKGLEKGEALLIKPCNSVHTLGMKFEIAVAFLDARGKVLHFIPCMPPGKLSPIIKGSKMVLEYSPKEEIPLQEGDLLQLSVSL